MKRTLGLLALSLLFLLPQGTEARRLPSTLGSGAVRVAVPDSTWTSIVDAHAGIPLLEARPTSQAGHWRRAEPLVAGIPAAAGAWHSRLLRAAKASKRGQAWALVLRGDLPPDLSRDALNSSIEDCLRSRPRGPWPGRALGLAGVTATVGTGADEATISIDLSAPVGALPLLLAGCDLRLAGLPSAFVEQDGALVANVAASAPKPLIPRIVRERSEDRADLLLNRPRDGRKRSISTDNADVVLLIPGAAHSKAAPFGLAGRSAAGRAERLEATALLGALWQGRGGETDRLLPAGVGPTNLKRPPVIEDLESAPPKLPGSGAASLRGTENDAVPLGWDRSDSLLVQIAERLALLASDQGRSVRPQAEGGSQLLRFQPRSTDPAIALLELACLSPQLADAAGARLQVAGLLHGSLSRRQHAAIELERFWLDEGWAIPLLSTQHWMVLDPDLEGVELRGDGVPVLTRAWSTRSESSAGGGGR